MKIGALALLAVLAVAGCSSLSNSLNRFVDPTPSARPTASCYQQYEKWAHPKKRKVLIHRINEAERNARAEERARDLAGYLRGLRALGRALATVPPIPYCADPHGYFTRMIAKMNAAADNTRSASAEGLRQALAPLQRVIPLIRKLIRELHRTVHRPSHTPGVNLAAATPARLPVHVWPAAVEPTALEAV